jgi:hypothetical protein
MIVAVAAQGLPSQYQLVVQDKSFVSRDLSGTVEDPTGAPLPGATVDLVVCSSSDRSPEVIKSVKSGPAGHFRFGKRPSITEYCMQISKDGFDQLRFSVVIAKTGRTLHVKLPVAT